MLRQRRFNSLHILSLSINSNEAEKEVTQAALLRLPLIFGDSISKSVSFKIQTPKYLSDLAPNHGRRGQRPLKGFALDFGISPKHSNYSIETDSASRFLARALSLTMSS